MNSATLPEHPVFGPAIGLRRNGAPIWSICGGAEGDPPGSGATTTEPPATEPTTPPDSGELGDGGKKALDSERKARAAAEKAQRALEARVKEFEDAQKTEAERTAERIKLLEQDAAKALRYEAAALEGIALTSAHRLNGNTLEELRADALAYKAELASVPPATPAVPPAPKPDPRQGGGQADAGGTMAAGRAAYEARKQRT